MRSRCFSASKRDFYDARARFFRPQPISSTPTETYTPMRFAMLQATLRDIYEIVATSTGDARLRSLTEDQIGRLNKLVLNGWDDRNADGIINWSDECAQVIDGLPRGGLQMGERTLTGEIGSLRDTFDAGPRLITVRSRARLRAGDLRSGASVSARRLRHLPDPGATQCQ